MIYYLVAVGIVSLIFGVLFLVSPQTIRNISDKVNRTVGSVDEKLYTLRIGTGVSLILIAILTFFVVYFLSKI